MLLKVLGSSSKGNCYLLQNKKETLIIECGIKFDEVKKALDFNLNNVVGCLITHEHKDHCKYINKVIEAGINVYASKGTLEALSLTNYRTKIIKSLEAFKIGDFNILPFDTKHDSSEPLGFLIKHPEMGTMLFATDTYYIEYKFKDLNHILVECNYSLDILNRNVEGGKVHPAMKNRVIRSHFELENVKEFLRANNLDSVQNVMLLHLSDGNSDSSRFVKEISEVYDRCIWIADKGKVINVGLFPF